jgi:hypothetical protein
MYKTSWGRWRHFRIFKESEAYCLTYLPPSHLQSRQNKQNSFSGLYELETWSLTLMKVHWLTIFCIRIFKPWAGLTG